MPDDAKPVGRWNSLTIRLLIGATLLCGGALATAFVLLTALLEFTLKHQVDKELLSQVRDLASRIEIVAAPDSNAPVITLPSRPNVSRYARVFSGYYWQIEAPGTELLRSQSLLDMELPHANPVALRNTGKTQEIAGPAGQRLRLVQRTIAFEGLDRNITISAAADLAPVESTLRELSLVLIGMLSLLGVGLISVAVFQTWIGLRPLQKVRNSLADIRQGKESRIVGDAPTEIAPLTRELNALLDHHHDLIERARTHARVLSRTIETPLQVLREEIQMAAPDRDLMREQIAAIDDIVHRRMAIARAGGANLLGQRADIARSIDALVYTLRHIGADRKVKIAVSIPRRPLWFAGEAFDFAELIGNLLDYSQRSAKQKVSLTAVNRDRRLLIVIVADRPPVTEAELPAAFSPGPGMLPLAEGGAATDVSLFIARDLAAHFQGTLLFGQTGQAALPIYVDLPAA